MTLDNDHYIDTDRDPVANETRKSEGERERKKVGERTLLLLGCKLPLVAFSHFTDETRMSSDGSCQHRNGIVIRSELLLLLLTLSAETSLSTISTQMRFVNVRVALDRVIFASSL